MVKKVLMAALSQFDQTESASHVRVKKHGEALNGYAVLKARASVTG